MKLPFLTGLACLGLTLVLLATFAVEERPSLRATDAAGQASVAHLGHGRPHPEFDSMLIGGSGAERGEPIWGLAFAFGALEIAVFGCCMLLGVRRNGVIGRAGKHIVAWSVVYLLAFAGTMLSYRSYMGADSLMTFGGLPVPTAWMLYVITPIPLVFLLIFVLGFREFIWNDDSERALARIVADKRAAEERR